LSILILRSGENAAAPLRVSLDKDMRGFLAKAIPGMVASSGPQLLMIAAAIVASASPSAVSWLYFANRLIELPLGLVGVAMGTVLIGELTRAVQSGDAAAVAHAESRALELAASLALPATLGLIVLAEPIVRLLFEHGAFTASDTAATARALVWLALGLPAQVLFKALAPAFFARENTASPLVAVLKGILLAAATAFVLGHWSGTEGIAAGIALGAWGSTLSLFRERFTRFDFAIDAAARPAVAAHRGRRGRDGCRAVAGADREAAGSSPRRSASWPSSPPPSHSTACFCSFSASPAGAKRLTRSKRASATCEG
jgi:putative peptidoglycan lipid II flippase